MSAVTNNRNITLPVVGGDSGTWGTLLNNGVMTQIDTVLGGNVSVTIDNSDVTLSQNQWNNADIILTGTLTGNRSLILPLSPNSVTAAVGGTFIVDNQTSGNFTVTVKTAAASTAGVTVSQGLRTQLVSDTVNVKYSDDSKATIIPVSGNPTGQIAGTAASANTPPSFAWDYTNLAPYFCTTSGTASVAQWTNFVASGSPLPVPQGYLTPVSNTPIITSDSIGATTVYYTPYQGTWTVIHNGSTLVPYQFSQMLLTLSASQAASNIYDVFLAYNGGTPVIGTGPSWTAGSGGSVTAGSCARGTGAGGTSLSRATQGIYVNTVSMSLIYNTGSGNNTITVAAGQGVYLGSIFIDSSAGQVTCHVTYGVSRKWGFSNAYYRQPIILQMGDASSSNWSYSTNAVRQSNGNSANTLTTFCCLADERVTIDAYQSATLNSNAGAGALIGIGVNSVSAMTGKQGSFIQGSGAPPNGQSGDMTAATILAPSLGINNINFLESGTGAATSQFNGTQVHMLMTAAWDA